MLEATLWLEFGALEVGVKDDSVLELVKKEEGISADNFIEDCRDNKPFDVGDQG